MQRTNGGATAPTALTRRRAIPKIKFFKKWKDRKQAKKVIKETNQVPYESPQRHKMPSEIHISPGTPGSPYSAVSGATGLDAPPMKAKSMFQSALPPLNSDSETASVHSYNLNTGRVNKTLFGENSSEIGLARTTVAASTVVTVPSPLTSQSQRELRRVQDHKTFLSKSKWFQSVVDWAFETVDSDKSGTIGKNELYTGVLLIHLKLAAYVGPAACRPASKEYVAEIYSLCDIDNSECLDKEEFAAIVTLLCSQIVSRVFLQLGVTLLIVPVTAQYLLDFFGDLAYALEIILVGIDDAEQVTERVWAILVSVLDFILPAGIKNCLSFVTTKTIEVVPDEFLASLPLTMISCTLGIILVPWMLYQVDGFFASLARRNAQFKKNLMMWN